MVREMVSEAEPQDPENLRAGMRLVIYRLQPFRRDMRIYLRCGKIHMAKQFLDTP